MKICFFIASLNNSGGTERALTAIAGEIVNYGYKVDIICWSGGTVSFFPLSNKIGCYFLYEKRDINIYKKYLPSLFKYKKLIKQLKPEVIVDVCIPLSLISIPATRFTNIKVVSWEQFNVKVSWNGFTGKLSRWLASKYATKIVVLTVTDEKEYRRRFKTFNQFVIPNPVSIDTSKKSTLTSKNVLAVGRLTYQKGFDMLLEAWKIIFARYTDDDLLKGWKLIIVGGGEDEMKLKNLSTKLKINDYVTFVKPTLQIEAFYKNATFFVMSSRFEGLPLALVEAKAFGLPTISFDCETGPREVITNEEDGLLIKANDQLGLADAIVRLIMDSKVREKFSVNSIEKAKNYQLQHVAKMWDILLQTI